MHEFDFKNLMEMKQSLDQIIAYTSLRHKMQSSSELEHRMLIDALLMQAQRFGEAANKLSSDFNDQYDEVPWKKFRFMRNAISHEYKAFDLKVLDSFIDLAFDLIDIVNDIYKKNYQDFYNS